MNAHRLNIWGWLLLALGLLSATAWAMPPRLDSSYGKLPLSFEANQGQTDGQVRYLSRGPGYTLFLTPTEAVLSLNKPANPGDSDLAARHPRAPQPKSPALPNAADWGLGTSPAIAALVLPKADWLLPDDKSRTATLRMSLEGANPHPVITSEQRLPGTVNYLKGKDPAGWRTGITTYGKVRYSEVYPGIDLVYYGNQRQLEHDFIVAPGVDPAQIRLAFTGAEQISLDAAGSLILRTGDGEVSLRPPLIYQERNGQQQTVEGRYLLRDNQRVGFEVAAYDIQRPLVIDPILLYSTYLGGGSEWGSGIAVDAKGQAYVTGLTYSSDFPTVNALQSTMNGSGDAFVAAFTADGTALRYATYLGGSDGEFGDDSGAGIAVDGKGQAYVTGMTNSSDFPTVNAMQPTLAGGPDAFVAALTAAGNGLRYSTYLGGDWLDGGSAIAVDMQGKVYVIGETDSSDFPTLNALQPHQPDNNGAFFVAAFKADGKALLYSTYLGGCCAYWGSGIAVDAKGQAYVTGGTNSSDFPTVNGLQQNLNGEQDAFVAAFSADGKTLRYSTFLGGSGGDYGQGIAVDAKGEASVTGGTESNDFPTYNAMFPTNRGCYTWCYSDAFVTELSTDGKALRYSTYLGGSERDSGSRVAVDANGQAYVTGLTNSPDFPSVNAPQQTYGGGEADAFVVALTANGKTLRYSTYLGGSSNDFGGGVAVDAKGQAYVTGPTLSSDFPTVNALQPSLNGVVNVFVAKFSAAESIANFSAFSPRARISFGPQDTDDSFQITASFVLDAQSNGIDPRNEAVTLQLGAFTATIPVGSFKQQGQGKVRFSGNLGKAQLSVDIYAQGSNRYLLWAKGSRAKLDGSLWPPTVGFAVGDDSGWATFRFGKGALRMSAINDGNIAAFSPRADISFGPKLADNTLMITAPFKLWAESNGIDPSRNGTYCDFSTFQELCGPFEAVGQGKWRHRGGDADGVLVTVDIYSHGSNDYLFWANVRNLNLGNKMIPPSFRLYMNGPYVSSTLGWGNAEFSMWK